jgi:hypothetical protein
MGERGEGEKGKGIKWDKEWGNGRCTILTVNAK